MKCKNKTILMFTESILHVTTMKCLLTFLFLLFSTSTRQLEVDVPTALKLQKAAQSFTKKLSDQMVKLTKYKEINQAFKDLTGVKFEKVNGGDLNKQFKTNLEGLLLNKKAVLDSLKASAQEGLKEYKYDPSIKEYDYHNMRWGNHTQVAVDPKFSPNVAINKTRSYVQVPTNIYHEKKEILNIARRTENMDTVFRDNEFNGTDDSLLYQYYGDSSGLFRVYPGNLNGYENGQTDFFDCRRRVWYQRASASPKDVVIIIDTSGSMVGNNIGIAKITAKSLIDTLGENDYFNVITTNKSVDYMSCIKYLVQATKTNKEYLKMRINNIDEPRETFNVSEGVREAFKIFDSGFSFGRENSALCNGMIMIITDGVEGDYTSSGTKKAFDELNKDKSVRVFTYLIGRVKNPDDRALKEIACANRGHFYKIETIGNVWDTVLGYLEVLSRPLAHSQQAVERPQYSPVYLDSTNAGMIMSISLGVFNHRNLTGVVGVDMLMRTLQQQVDSGLMGSYSRAILINNNGFVMLHPLFRDQTGYLPDPSNVYLNDLEHSLVKNDSIDLKRAMLDRKTDSQSFPVHWLYDNNRRVVRSETTYFYAPINNTEFSAGMAVSEQDAWYFRVMEDPKEDKWYENYLKALQPSSNCTVMVAPRQYCSINSTQQAPRNIKVFPTAAELYEFLSTPQQGGSLRIPDDCNRNLVRTLLVSADVISRHIHPREEKLSDDVRAVYAVTSSGYTRFCNALETAPLNRDAPHTPLYKHALATPHTELVLTPSDNALTVDVTAPTWLENKDGSNNVLVALSGARLTSSLMDRLLLTSMEDNEYTNCHDNTTVTCVILDEAGYIIAGNRQRVGLTFFGELQGRLMEHFTDTGIFTKIVIDDTQAECPEPKLFTSAANILLTPARLLFGATKFAAETVWLLLTTLVLLLQTPHSADAQQSSPNMSCTKLMPFYVLNRTFAAPMRGTVQCSATVVQTYSLAPIPSTNLLLVVADRPASSVCAKPRVTLEHVKNDDVSFCGQTEHYRVAPGHCFNQPVPDEDKSEFCGGAGTPKVSLMFITAALLVVSIVI